jgi:hypothetical protein
MNEQTHQKTSLPEITNVARGVDELRRYRWRVVDAKTGEFVARRAGWLQSGRMLDWTLQSAWDLGLFSSTDVVVIEEFDAGDIDQFTYDGSTVRRKGVA